MTDESPALGLDLPEVAPATSPYRVLARKYRPQTFEQLIGFQLTQEQLRYNATR